jgi:Co/Zn/Cd efflux system component
VLWDNTTRVAFTLAAAALGLVAVHLMPGRKQIEERMTAGYDRSGKYAIFVLAFLVMGIAGVLAWEVFRYHNNDLWVGGNMLVLAVLGIGIFGGNLWTLRLVRLASEHVEVVEAEVVELSLEAPKE